MYIYKNKRGWSVRPWRNGTRLYKGGFKTKAEAKAWGEKNQTPKK